MPKYYIGQKLRLKDVFIVESQDEITKAYTLKGSSYFYASPQTVRVVIPVDMYCESVKPFMYNFLFRLSNRFKAWAERFDNGR